MERFAVVIGGVAYGLLFYCDWKIALGVLLVQVSTIVFLGATLGGSRGYNETGEEYPTGAGQKQPVPKPRSMFGGL